MNNSNTYQENIEPSRITDKYTVLDKEANEWLNQRGYACSLGDIDICSLNKADMCSWKIIMDKYDNI